MLAKRVRPVGALFLVLMLTLGSVGIGFGLWSKSLTVIGTVNTGNVNARFLAPFTDDDNVVNDPDLDSGDTGTCREGENTSCDPAGSGRDPKPRYNKDVGVCVASRPRPDEDIDEAPGIQLGFVTLRNAYPSYYCTAWFPISNNGTIPIKVMRIDITNGAGEIIVSNAIPSRIYRLDLADDGVPPQGGGGGVADLELHISDIRLLEQIDPGESTLMNLDMHVLQPAPQGETFVFDVHVVLAQWNEVYGCMGAVSDVCIEADGFTTLGDGIPWAAEVRVGDTLTVFDRAPDGRSGVDMFDQDNSGSWTLGDDLHTEAGLYGGSRDGDHDPNDPVLLDWNANLLNGQAVDCDLDTGTYCGLNGIDHTVFKFYDTDGDGVWNNGEDIILDLNQNGIFD